MKAQTACLGRRIFLAHFVGNVRIERFSTLVDFLPRTSPRRTREWPIPHRYNRLQHHLQTKVLPTLCFQFLHAQGIIFELFSFADHRYSSVFGVPVLHTRPSPHVPVQSNMRGVHSRVIPALPGSFFPHPVASEVVLVDIVVFFDIVFSSGHCAILPDRNRKRQSPRLPPHPPTRRFTPSLFHSFTHSPAPPTTHDSPSTTHHPRLTAHGPPATAPDL